MIQAAVFNHTVQRVLLAGLGLLLSACAIGPKASMRSLDRVTTFGANPQFDNERYEMVDLITLLDPENKRSRISTTTKAVDLFWLDTAAETAASTKEADAEARRQLALAEIAFYSYDDVAARRNRIQDRLIGASNQRCAAYKVYLNRFDAYQQSGFGSATTVLGGAAAIVGGLKDARILGGLAGISSGVQAEISQGFLGNLASYVIVPGIELRRKTILEEINQRRASNVEYTLQAALADSARYHGACTLVVGLEQAKEAIQTVENPGMRMMAVTLNNVMQTRAMQRTIAKQENNTAGPEDYVIPSFRFDDLSVGPVVGRSGMRASEGLSSITRDAPESVVKRVADLAKRALDDAQNASVQLVQATDELQKEIDAPTKAALQDQFKSVRSEFVARVDKLKAAKAALITRANANSARANNSLACLSKLEDRIRFADAPDRAASAADLALAVVMVNNAYMGWLVDARKPVDTWDKNLRAAITAGSLGTLKDKAATDINPSQLAKALDDAIEAGKGALMELPSVDFKARSIDCT